MVRERQGRVYFDQRFVEQRVQRRITLSSWASELEESRADDGDGPTMRERMKKLRFDGACASAFDLLPLIHVAWADGVIQSGERATILGVLETMSLSASTRRAMSFGKSGSGRTFIALR